MRPPWPGQQGTVTGSPTCQSLCVRAMAHLFVNVGQGTVPTSRLFLFSNGSWLIKVWVSLTGRDLDAFSTPL